jgi:hypothetical protein
MTARTLKLNSTCRIKMDDRKPVDGAFFMEQTMFPNNYEYIEDSVLILNEDIPKLIKILNKIRIEK